MIIHKYTSVEGAIKTIKNLQLKVNSVNQFNDPFENLPIINDLTNEQLINYFNKSEIQNEMNKRIQSIGLKGKNFNDYLDSKEIIEKIRKEINSTNVRMSYDIQNHFSEKLKVSCFSAHVKHSEHKQILMWSHYSDDCKGIRIHFDSDNLVKVEHMFKKVNYSKNRVRFDAFGADDENLLFKLIQKLVTTKASSWEYENEYRLIIDSKNCIEDLVLNMYFVKINPTSIKRIDFGYKCVKENEIRNCLKENNLQDIKLFKAYPNKKEFKFDFEAI